MCGVSWCCYRGWVGVVSSVVDGCGWCVCRVVVLCGFSVSLVGVGDVSLVGEVLLLEGVRFPCFALLETQLCQGCSLVSVSVSFLIACPCGFPVCWVCCCGWCCGFRGGIIVYCFTCCFVRFLFFRGRFLIFGLSWVCRFGCWVV